VPNFFKEASNPRYPSEKFYQFIPENNYWERRDRGDWSGLPDLW